MDRRLTPFSGRVAHASVASAFPDAPQTEGTPARISSALAPLLASPDGAIDRQLIYGASVRVIDRKDDHTFVQATKDGYCGWVETYHLGQPHVPTHRLITPASHLYPEPRVQAPPLHPLFLNAEILVTGQEGAWAKTSEGYIPARHLAPIDAPFSHKDPASVAESLLHAPYVWGGNSAFGVDCSGMVQLSHHACGLPCPADSDLQRALGQEVPKDAPFLRNDLLFWRGHVAMALSPDLLIHANGYTMSVAIEPIRDAMGRIAALYGSNLIAHRRIASLSHL